MKAERKNLEMDSLIEGIRTNFNKIKDPGKRTSKYSISDCLLSGLGMFYLKMPSLLQFDQAVKSDTMCKNLMNLYKVSQVPSDTHFRVRLDHMEYEKHFQYCFDEIISRLQRGKVLENFKYHKEHYIVAIDGTGYFSSNQVHCENCCVKEHRNGELSYYHQVLAAVLVCPGIKTVIPLGIEPIVKQDGTKKNDCEMNAAKRLLKSLKESHKNLKIIIVMDALYANAPMIKLLNELKFKYIITGKDLSYLRDEFEFSESVGEFSVNNSSIRMEYKYASELELNATHKDIKVNYLEYSEIPDKETATKKKFYSTWITNLELNKKTAFEIMKAGRARWRIENETFNTLKNMGYNFEHNYGHGDKNLSIVLCHLMFIAFGIDQINAYCSYWFKQVLEKLGTKKYIWGKLQFVWEFVEVASWEEFYEMAINIFTGKVKVTVSSG